MGLKKKNNIISVQEVIIVILLFLFFGYLAQRYLDFLQGFIGRSILGMLFYVFLLVIAVVIAPINGTPFVAVAAHLWGWVLAGVLSIIGWTLGSIIAFLLARRYGTALLKRFVSIKKLESYEKLLPKENLFWSIVFLRMTVPVDILSYVLGLFSTLKLREYFFATLIGVAPFAFVFAYVGRLPLFYQLLALSTALLLILFGILVNVGRNKIERK